MYIGTISSIATLILFFFYFIGRTWTLFKDVKFPLGGLNAHVVCYEDFDDFSIDLGGTQVIRLVAQENLTYLEVWSCSWDNSFNSIRLEKKVSDRLHYLPKDNPIYIKCDIPEGIPHNAVVFQRYDGLKGILVIGNNGRENSDGVSFSYNRLEITAEAILYNLVR